MDKWFPYVIPLIRVKLWRHIPSARRSIALVAIVTLLNSAPIGKLESYTHYTSTSQSITQSTTTPVIL
jgi:hypothetical protein